jgi:hydantoinase/carbamoylase family amidase
VRPFETQRPIEDLRELADLTGGPRGARRVAWTREWERARAWLQAKLDGLGTDVARDAAGNLTATLRGASDAILLIGSHLDSVPCGGWLDGALGVCAALEVLRRHADEPPPVTLRLVDWADEEGARFGRSLLGSSAAAGLLSPDDVRELRDADGVPLVDALRDHGVDLDGIGAARATLEGVAAYLELHIEQGPALEAQGEPVGVVEGTFGVERHAVAFAGVPRHSGSTPMEVRHDALAAAARLTLAVREDAIEHGGVATVGAISVQPGVPTIIPGGCELVLDQRALDREALAAMLAGARAAAEAIAADEGVAVRWRPLMRLEPVPFDAELVALAERACAETHGRAVRLASGALHDCSAVARRVPAAMLFAPSIAGISHSAREDTAPEDLERALAAYARLVELTAQRIAAPAALR